MHDANWCKCEMLPCLFQLFICSLAFSTFTVDLDKPQNRLQLSFILLLTTITFKFVVSQTLPRISYLTYLVSFRFCSGILRYNNVKFVKTWQTKQFAFLAALKKTNVGSMCILHIGSMHKQTIYFNKPSTLCYDVFHAQFHTINNEINAQIVL